MCHREAYRDRNPVHIGIKRWGCGIVSNYYPALRPVAPTLSDTETGAAENFGIHTAEPHAVLWHVAGDAANICAVPRQALSNLRISVIYKMA